jgi:hypothetical protein
MTKKLEPFHWVLDMFIPLKGAISAEPYCTITPIKRLEILSSL